MLNIYPSSDPMPLSADYCVKVNGQQVPVHSARVSKFPFNRRWPGHQRQLDQTEMVAFVCLAADEPLDIEISSSRDLSHAVIRPVELGITPQVHGGTARFSLLGDAYFTFEPDGRHDALHFFIDPPADYGVHPEDASLIYFGPGVHEPGLIELKDGQTLFLDEGAVVFACIRAFDARNIRILGRGLLDNSHNRETILFEANEEGNSTAVRNAVRQHTIQLEYCTDVLIDGITIRDSLVYNIRPVACRNLTISHVKIIGCWRYNSDGIDMHNCENVLIEHCFLRTFDDAICIKGFDCYYQGDVEKAVQDAMHYRGGNYVSFRQALIRDCIIWNDWGKSLEIGAETRAEEICQVVFEGCHIIHVQGGALDCSNVDYAYVHDITWRDISIEFDDVIPTPAYQKSDGEIYRNARQDYQPTVCSAVVMCHPEYSAGGGRRGRNEDLTFENIRLYSNKRPICYFRGFDDAHCTRKVVIRGFRLNGKRLSVGDFDLHVDDFCEGIHCK
ncbi:MAG: hypothetical protein IJJ33_11925 [Victivallales bacterium]|nr:hypothetical protein [Victivallales bacterium]